VVGMLTDVAFSLATGGIMDMPSGPVLINSLPANTTDEKPKNLPLLPHLPMPPGVSHVKPPSGETILPLGALKVTFGGNNAIRIGEMALSCSDPSPLPTSKVIVIPKGSPVMVMGAPGIDVKKAMGKFLMGKAKKAAFKAATKAAKRFAKLVGPRLRNRIPKKECTSAGHPVDVATGRVFTDATEFTLPGPLPLTFERSYFSSWSHRDSPLGFGWSHSLDLALWFEPGSAVYRNPEGQEIVFDLGRPEDAALEQEFFEATSRDTLVRERNGWRVVTAAGLIHHFVRDGKGPFRVVRTTTRHPEVAITYDYDREGRLREVVDCVGRVVRFEHDRSGRLARILLPDPQDPAALVPHTEYLYSDDGLLVAVRDAHRQSTRYTYDGRLMVEETDRNGVTFYWLYDGRGSSARCLRTWGLAGAEVIYNEKLDYDPKNHRTLVVDSYGNKTLYEMNAFGSIISVTDPLGGQTLRAYDEDLQLVSETDPAGRRTKYAYGPRGQLVSTVFADGSQTVQKYDPHFPELVKLHQTEAGALWRFQYDGHGQLVETRGPEADAFRQYQWEAGHLKAVVEASGARTEVLERDRWRNPVVLRLSAGAQVRREYDVRGRVKALVNPWGGREERQYDLLDRVVAVREADGNERRLVYDPEANLLEATDRLSTTRFSYACWNKLATREEGAGPGRPGETIRFVWGQEGELREIRNERNHDYRFTYDPCLRLEREIGFDLQETRYSRDPAGQVVKIEKPAAQVHTDLQLDPRGRVVSVAHSDGTWSRFAYRKDGELIEAANDAATVRFKKDGLGRVLTETQGDVEVKSFHVAGNRTRIESTLGAAFDLARDVSGNLTSLSIGLPEQGWQKTLSIEYDQAGLETRRHLPGGVTADWHHDHQGRPTRQSVESPVSGSWSRDYHWTHNDRITQIDDTRFGTSTYDHDPRGRLIAEHQGDTTIHRAMDEVGNVYRTPDRSDRRYARGGIIRNDGEVTFAFDLLGNMTERALPDGTSWKYAWDGAGMLKEVVRPDGMTVAFAYDALGRRVSKRAGEAETRWVWDGDVMLHEVGGGGTVTWCYEPESFTPIARVDGGSVHSVLPDHLGVPVAAYDRLGGAATQSQLDVFGVARFDALVSNNTLCLQRWPGQYDDREVGLHYNRFRYYDSGLGEYISADPIGPAGGLVIYGYVHDVLAWIDPFGLHPCDPKNPVDPKPIRRIYQHNPKHRDEPYFDSRGREVSRKPRGDAQAMLDASVQLKPTSPERVGVEPSTGRKVIFRRHLASEFETEIRELFHGYVP
jgi:RHS repeat-associated protein